MLKMRGLVMAAAIMATVACTAASTPEANGYEVQLYFDGAPLGGTLALDKPSTVTVRRIEQNTAHCTTAGASCDATAETPITLIAATCDALCSVTPVVTDGVVRLETTSQRAGDTTLRVRVRSDVDGSEWSDAYPLAFR
jgi:hypothetical protein